MEEVPEGTHQEDVRISFELREARPIYIKNVADENLRLKMAIELLEDLLNHHGLDNWLSVRTTVNILTDKTEIDKLVETINPDSGYHKDKSGTRRVKEFVECLEEWWEEEVLSPQNSLIVALEKFKERLRENQILLSHCLKP